MIRCMDDRLSVANAVIQTFAPGTFLRLESGYVLVEWKNHRGPQSKRWMTRGQDFYPVWHKAWGHGGTATTALAQLVRWIKGKPVLPLPTWQYWSGDKCRLLRQGDAQMALESLQSAGYPATATCVLCKETITGGMDWWSLNGMALVQGISRVG